jgi:Tfp pilus assembly protein PilF
VACKRAVTMDPSRASAHFKLGATLHSQDDIDSAVAVYRKAVAIEPDLAPAHNSWESTR